MLASFAATATKMPKQYTAQRLPLTGAAHAAVVAQGSATSTQTHFLYIFSRVSWSRAGLLCCYCCKEYQTLLSSPL